MTKDEALKMALEALEYHTAQTRPIHQTSEAITAIKEALAQPEQKYHRGDRLICLETEEYCVIHISGTDRQWVKFPDSHIGVYTNEQVAELFELLPKEPEQEPIKDWIASHNAICALLRQAHDALALTSYPPTPHTKVGCAECGVNGNHALYCVACAEKYLEDKNTKGQK